MNKKKYILWLLIILLFPINILALDVQNSKITINNNITKKLTDNNYNTKEIIKGNSKIHINNPNSIKHLYIIYELASQIGSITINNEVIEIGSNNYLHEYIDLTKYNSNDLFISYDKDVIISEIYIFSDNNLPTWVQKWQTINQADLMLFSTHSDDEHLFFGGLIPTYLNQRYQIQVVYLIHHNSEPNRLHEQLNGLWAVGLTNYPVIGLFPDAYSTSLKGALNNLEINGFNLDNVIQFQVHNIRKYRPKVVVGHDEEGEYSHGQHILNTFALKTALIKANDPNYKNIYSIYDVPKVYLHLYKNNPIILNYDIPLSKYNGATAYEVSKKGYLQHKSQQYTWFTDWFNGKNNGYTSATQITKYSPIEFGLYKSNVGEDILKNNMFENIKWDNKHTTNFTIYEFQQIILDKIIYLSIILLTIPIIILITSKTKTKKK
ncbi:MAG: hypothetical protein GX861_01530 [Tenericutes bacterium]|nr:hypothetical protein [Mycoplasmatota bacterium]